MGKIIISVEAMSDITEQIQNEYNIAVVPMEYMVDGKVYNTRDGMSYDDFYAAMRNGAVTKTSQVNTEEAYNHIETLLKSGADVIHFSMSSNISGTYGNFRFAAEDLNKRYGNRVRVVDALSASCGIMLPAVACAVKAEKENCSLDELFDYAEQLKHNVSALFTVDSLKYLARTGRVSMTAATLGDAIHLKVALRVSEDGFLVPYKKVLSRKRALSEIVGATKRMYVPHFDTIYVGHAGCPDDADHVANELRNALNVKVITLPLGPVVISHGGPGSICIYFTSDGRAIK